MAVDGPRPHMHPFEIVYHDVTNRIARDGYKIVASSGRALPDPWRPGSTLYRCFALRDPDTGAVFAASSSIAENTSSRTRGFYTREGRHAEVEGIGRNVLDALTETDDPDAAEWRARAAEYCTKLEAKQWAVECAEQVVDASVGSILRFDPPLTYRIDNPDTGVCEPTPVTTVQVMPGKLFVNVETGQQLVAPKMWPQRPHVIVSDAQ